VSQLWEKVFSLIFRTPAASGPGDVLPATRRTLNSALQHLQVRRNVPSRPDPQLPRPVCILLSRLEIGRKLERQKANNGS